MVTSTSTPGSMLMDVICFTISDGLCRSISRLWILIWYLSQVFEPSPQGVLRVVMRRTLVGMRTGPFTFRLFSLAPLIRSAHTEMCRNRLKFFGPIPKLLGPVSIALWTVNGYICPHSVVAKTVGTRHALIV